MDETEVATAIREVMSREWADCTWQVFVGRNFGSQVTYEETRYIYFYIGQVRCFCVPLARVKAACEFFFSHSPSHPFQPQVGFVVFSSN